MPDLTVARDIVALVLGITSLIGMGYRCLLLPRLQRLESVMDRVDYHLAPNGHEELVPLQYRGQPTRLLLLQTVSTSLALETRVVELEKLTGARH